MKHYVEAWKRYTDFKGRSSRAAYWYPFVLTIIISFVLGHLQIVINSVQMLLYNALKT